MKQNTLKYPRPLYQNYELLADYVDGLLETTQRKQLAEAISKSEEAAMIVEGIRQYYALHGHDREGLEAYLDELAARFGQEVLAAPPPTLGGMLRRRPWLRVAAVVLLLVGLLPVLLWLARPWGMDAEALIAQHLEQPYPLPNVQRGDTHDLRNAAYQAYHEGQYSLMIQRLEAALGDQSGQLTDFDRFYLGLSHLYTGDYAGAIDLLRPLEQGQAPRFEQQARWYLALAYLRQGQREAAMGLLQEVAHTEGHFRQQEALRLLEKLQE
ncbi:MAG: hypothetical protein D6730_01305 [Bacteroidetes bacterium]|nr:MAG: hypothetical protein D6730_01305 [Bacteroidota bacterium]